uniref:3-oxo-5alpha-steroid 4-dehydrogenase (NADP(+)) n=1 Tax=Arion vulgaris TaxID=1028688 RepID=A0A0B6Z3K1_9EUPU
MAISALSRSWDVLNTMVIQDKKTFIEYISYMFLIWAALVVLTLTQTTAPYGRYSRQGWGILIPGRFAWAVQELPSLCVPLLLLFFTDCPKVNNNLNLFAVGLFLLHYFHRSLVFAFLIRGGKSTPLVPFLLAIFFCSLNGYIQTGYLLKYVSLEWTPQTYPRIITGTTLFFLGMAINIHSDSILRNLRKEGESNYKIPYGGMFTYVSGANFFGEILEWFGFAILSWTLPAFSFAVFTMFNIGPRAVQHHRWYKEKFDDYPKDRKALIPFVL